MFGSQVIKERLDITEMNLQCRSHTSMKVNFFKKEKHLQTLIDNLLIMQKNLLKTCKFGSYVGYNLK